MAYKFKSITLYTDRLSDQYQFYTKVLEFPLVDSDAMGFSLICGDSVLNFKESENPHKYHYAFNIPENQVETAKSWLRERLGLILYEGKEVVDFPNWNAHSLYFLDPAGNIVEFIARHNLNNGSKLSFSGKSITEISEIGIPTHSIGDRFKDFKNRLNFEMYWGNQDAFAAIGHEQSLFITVPIDRLWFMTEDFRSEITPLSILLEENGKKLEFSSDGRNYHWK